MKTFAVSVRDILNDPDLILDAKMLSREETMSEGLKMDSKTFRRGMGGFAAAATDGDVLVPDEDGRMVYYTFRMADALVAAFHSISDRIEIDDEIASIMDKIEHAALHNSVTEEEMVSLFRQFARACGQ